jgi:hypothetical protein
VAEAVKANSIYKEEDTVVPRYDLPKLNMIEIFVENDYITEDRLFHTAAKTMQERRDARRQSLANRTDKSAEIQPLLDEIAQLRQDLLAANQEIVNLNIQAAQQITG